MRESDKVGNPAIEQVLDFLRERTPSAWFAAAPDHVSELLIDHANFTDLLAGRLSGLHHHDGVDGHRNQTCDRNDTDRPKH